MMNKNDRTRFKKEKLPKQGSETDSRCAESEKEGRTEGACICIPDYTYVLNIKGWNDYESELKRHNHLQINAETLNNEGC